MDYPVTQDDILLCTLPSRAARLKVELMTMQGLTLLEISGETIDGTLRIDAESDVRRIIDLTLESIDESYGFGADKRIWFDKKIAVSYGVLGLDGEWKYFPMGVFAFTGANFSYDETASVAKLTAADLMAFTLQDRGSQIGANEVVIEVDSNIRNAMIATLDRFTPLSDYAIEEFPADQQIVPYDIEAGAGAYPHDIIKKLRDLYPNYETFMDIYGTFICRKIPERVDDPLFLDEAVLDPLIISEQVSADFGVRNVTEIRGAEIEPDRTVESCVQNGGRYDAILALYEVYVNDERICVEPSGANVSGQTMRINALSACPIVIRKYTADGEQTDEPIQAGVMRAGYPYVLRYMDGVFIYEGELNVHAIVKEVSALPSATQQEEDKAQNDCRTIEYIVNPDSPFTTEKIGEIRQVLSGGEYEDIYTSQLAVERARWENWKKTRLNDGVTVTMLLLPFMEVNKKIRYTSPRTGERLTYLIKGISMDFGGGTMTLDLIRFYPYYIWQ